MQFMTISSVFARVGR